MPKYAFIGADYFVVWVSKKFTLLKPFSNQLKYIRTLNILYKMINKPEKLPNHFSLTRDIWVHRSRCLKLLRKQWLNV